MALPLEGKVAIVTGGSRGIGKAIALQLAADGADVVVCARSDAPRAEKPGTITETVTAIQALGRRGVGTQMDVSNDDDVRRVVATAERELGGVDILVNNAAANAEAETLGAYMTVEPGTLDVAWRANVRAPYFFAQCVVPLMAKRGGGTIVNISSGSARMPAAPSGPPPPPPAAGAPGSLSQIYGITKAALERYGAGVAPELWAYNVGIVSLRPGFTWTERLQVALGPDFDFSHAERPETTGKAVAFICRDPMAFTGQVVVSREIVDLNNL